ncbi:DUF7882 family protein [Curtobacterium sp. Leaf261]|uniref:DUF7882 family protein n=1 Tax=Curtobacterium sp. Leaf261 TaxID=1736311 RepID=UPI000B0F3900
MGYIVYDGDVLEFKVEDRLLAHLQIVIINKFRRNESMMFSWREPAETGDGRSTVWLAPSIGLRFKFAGGRPPAINPTWLAALYELADSGRGLHAVEEPVQDRTTRLPGTSGDAVDWPKDRVPSRQQRTPRPLAGERKQPSEDSL